ncbi:MAG: acyl-CoA dehydrogenase family protein [Bacteroidota bacterium]
MNPEINTDQLTFFRNEIRTWLEANCPLSMRTPMLTNTDYYWGGTKAKFTSKDQEDWFNACKEKGWLVPQWPKQYGGGGMSKVEFKIWREEMDRLGCRPPLFSFGIVMLGPVLLKFGTEEQRLKYLPPIARGEIRWAQGYSEPNAGSDLASLQTKALDHGDYYVVNGQKVWTSYADQSDWIFCLVRTDFEASKHRGISFLLIDMNSEGVSTQPIKLISGKSPFCETFLDNVRVPKENLVGEPNVGWTIAKYLLSHEREMIGGLGDNAAVKNLAELAIETIGTQNGILADTSLRADITKWQIDKMAFDMTVERMNDEAKAGQSIGAEASFFKYYGTELNKDRLELTLAIAGSAGLEWEGEASDEGAVARGFLRTKGNSIEGGTSEIQLNIVAKHILRLPSAL